MVKMIDGVELRDPVVIPSDRVLVLLPSVEPFDIGREPPESLVAAAAAMARDHA